MKLITILFALALVGCSTQQVNRAVCLGTGTCDTSGVSATPARGSFTPSSVTLPSGTYVIVPNYSTGSISSVIQTSRGK